MSSLTVQNIQGSASSSNTINVASGHKISGAAGSIVVPGTIVQTIQNISAQIAVTITSTSFADSGFNVNITSKLASSKFLVTLSGGGWYDNGNGSCAMWLTFQRNAAGGSYDYVTNGYQNNWGLIRMSGDGGTWNIKPYSAQIIDSPSVAAGVTLNYRVMIRANGQSSQFQSSDRGVPIIQVQEIAQ